MRHSEQTLKNDPDAGLGDATEVFQHLELAVQGRSSWIPSLPADPKFAAFRADPRFQQLLISLTLAPKR